MTDFETYAASGALENIVHADQCELATGNGGKSADAADACSCRDRAMFAAGQESLSWRLENLHKRTGNLAAWMRYRGPVGDQGGCDGYCCPQESLCGERWILGITPDPLGPDAEREDDEPPRPSVSSDPQPDSAQ